MTWSLPTSPNSSEATLPHPDFPATVAFLQVLEWPKIFPPQAFANSSTSNVLMLCALLSTFHTESPFNLFILRKNVTEISHWSPHLKCLIYLYTLLYCFPTSAPWLVVLYHNLQLFFCLLAFFFFNLELGTFILVFLLLFTLYFQHRVWNTIKAQ